MITHNIKNQILRIAFLGPAGTFSEEAVTKYLNGRKAYPVACNTLDEICRGIQEYRWEEGLLPVENSTEGAVGRTMDLLVEYSSLKIRQEILLPVRHNLMAPPGVTMEQIELVVSHPQALSQCRRYLEENLPWAATREMASTAHAAREVAKGNRPWAALASAVAASTYGLKILARDINDCGENVTRFLVLGREEAKPAGANKTSIILTVNDRPGALYSILGEFARRGINLTRIESRPSKKRLGEYIFFIDFAGHKDHPEVAEALQKIKEKCITCQVAGSYPAALKITYNYSLDYSLSDLRRNIDMVDREILDLLAHRMTLSDQAARYKRPGEVRDKEREKEVLEGLAKEARERGLDPVIVRGLFKVILSYSVSRQNAILSGQITVPSAAAQADV